MAEVTNELMYELLKHIAGRHLDDGQRNPRRAECHARTRIAMQSDMHNIYAYSPPR